MTNIKVAEARTVDPTDESRVTEMVEVLVGTLTTPEALEYHSVETCPPVEELRAAFRLLFPFFSGIRSVQVGRKGGFGIGSLMLEPNDRFSLSVYPGSQEAVIGLHKPNDCSPQEAVEAIHKAVCVIMETADMMQDEPDDEPDNEEIQDEPDNNVPPTTTKH